MQAGHCVRALRPHVALQLDVAGVLVATGASTRTCRPTSTRPRYGFEVRFHYTHP